MDYKAILEAFGKKVGSAIEQSFDVIDEVQPGVPMLPEALSTDHTVGIYCQAIPLKMREHLDGFERISLEELKPQFDGKAAMYLEYEPLQGVQFRAEWLQYIEEGFAAMVDEVKYSAKAVLGAIWATKQAYGEVYIYLHKTIPMPLWIRSTPLGVEDASRPSICLQAYSGDSFIPTNIHVEVDMEYARVWVPGVHTYYKKI